MKHFSGLPHTPHLDEIGATLPFSRTDTNGFQLAEFFKRSFAPEASAVCIIDGQNDGELATIPFLLLSFAFCHEIHDLDLMNDYLLRIDLRWT